MSSTSPPSSKIARLETENGDLSNGTGTGTDQQLYQVFSVLKRNGGEVKDDTYTQKLGTQIAVQLHKDPMWLEKRGIQVRSISTTIEMTTRQIVNCRLLYFLFQDFLIDHELSPGEGEAVDVLSGWDQFILTLMAHVMKEEQSRHLQSAIHEKVQTWLGTGNPSFLL